MKGSVTFASDRVVVESTLLSRSLVVGGAIVGDTLDLKAEDRAMYVRQLIALLVKDQG
jgi:hypothetical protein